MRSRDDDNYMEGFFWTILKSSWMLIVVCATTLLYLFRLMPQRDPNSPYVVSRPQVVFIHNPFSIRHIIVFALFGIGCGLLLVSLNNSSHPLGVPGAIALMIAAIFVEIIYSSSAPRAAPDNSKATQLPPEKSVMYTINLPIDTEWNSQQALHLIEQLAESVSGFMLVLDADHTAIRWRVVQPNPTQVGVIEPIIRSIYPRADVEKGEIEPDAVLEPFFRVLLSFKQVSLFVAPITYVTDIKRGNNQFDPLVALTQAMSDLQPGERVRITLGVIGIASKAHKQGEKLVTQSTIHPLQWATGAGIQDALMKKAYHLDRVDRFVPEDQRVLEEKLNHKLYHCVELLQIDTVDTLRAAELTTQLVSQFTHFSYLPFNALDFYETDLEACITQVEKPRKAAWTDSISRIARLMEAGNGQPSHMAANQRRERAFPMLILEPREIASLWHLPYEDFTASRITWSRGLVRVPERTRVIQAGVRLGQGVIDGGVVPVVLPHADRVTHLNLIGRTGTGKSTLLHHLIHQDIARGAGVVVIDPHGNLVRDVLRVSIPETREHDVVLIDVANPAYPPPLNPLRGAGTYAATHRVLSVIERLFDGLEGAPRMASYLRSALLLLRADPEATLRDLSRIFLDDVYRERLLNTIDNPELEDFWDMQFNAASPQMRQQIADPVLSRIRPFYANPYLYPMLCHPDALDFAALLREKRVVLISLAVDEENVHGQERDLLGALLMTQLQIAAMREQRSTPIFVYIDEVQRFVTTSLAEVLTEARKFGVVMTTANQYLGQLTGKTLEAVMGNVGTTLVFGCSPDDANALSLYVKPDFTPQKLVNLDRFSAAVKMQVDGHTQPAFSLLTDPPLPLSEDAGEREARIRKLSQETYVSKSRESVSEWLKARYPRRSLNRGGEPPKQDGFYE